MQFAESDYASNEDQGRIVTLIQRLGSIDTDLVFRIILQNYTQVNVSGVFLAEDFPTVPNFDEDRPNIAKSKCIDVCVYSTCTRCTNVQKCISKSSSAASEINLLILVLKLNILNSLMQHILGILGIIYACTYYTVSYGGGL